MLETLSVSRCVLAAGNAAVLAIRTENLAMHATMSALGATDEEHFKAQFAFLSGVLDALHGPHSEMCAAIESHRAKQESNTDRPVGPP